MWRKNDLGQEDSAWADMLIGHFLGNGHAFFLHEDYPVFPAYCQKQVTAADHRTLALD